VRTSPLDTIIRYYDGCSTGDVDLVLATLHPEVVHYVLAPNPGAAALNGAADLATHWCTLQRRSDARWLVDHCLAGEDEAVVESTMFWVPPGGAEQIATRGAEWFAFTGGLIREIRSYYRQEPHTTELDGFPYLARGYSAPGAEHHGARHREQP
jgi:SnoaL-like protein